MFKALQMCSAEQSVSQSNRARYIHSLHRIGVICLKPDTLPAIIGVISEADFNAALGQWQVATAVGADGTITARRGPNIAEQGKARYFARICRLKLGVDHTAGSAPTQALGGAPSSTASRKVKLSQVLSQLDDTEIELLPESEIITMYGRYEVLFGKGQRPPNNREPSSEQLAALKSLLDSSQTPYVDMAIWGPFGSRIRKKLKFQGLTLNKEGDLVQTELFGPPNIQAWKASFQVFSNCMIMLDAADLGALLQYQERVERMHERYGERTCAMPVGRVAQSPHGAQAGACISPQPERQRQGQRQRKEGAEKRPAADDPAVKIVDWLEQGAPAGVTLQPDLDGIFPEVDQDNQLLDFDVLHTDFDTFQNYLGVEDNPAAKEALQGYIDKGYLVPYDTLEECARALGHEPVLSKLGCISKTKLNSDGTQTVKHRIILDARRSNVTSATQRRYRSVLPRLTDAVQDALVFASELQPGETMEQLIADISDAFWQIPVHPQERRFFVAKFQGRFLSFVRTAQGSRAAPLTFCAVMAMLSRFAQALFFRDAGCHNHPEEARLQVYTDDPWLIARGSQSQINRTFAVLMIAWELFGLPVATHKAVRGVCLKWIGMKLEVSPSEVKVHVPEDKVLELEALSLQLISGNVVSFKQLRSYTGKVMNIATVIHTWRPFVQQLYAALNTDATSGAPRNCTWTKQIQTPVYWLLAFLHQLRSHLVRRWDVAAFANKGEHVAIMWDASPYGLGAVLILNGVIREYLFDVAQPFEMELLGITVGSSESQQAMEALAGLVALRIWKPHWMSARAFLALRSDNVGALTLFGRLKTSSRSNSIIAREFSLDLGDSSFAPQVTEHIPGFSNVICDQLSRIFDPTAQYSIPGCLHGVPRVPCFSRDRTWWRSLCPPQLVR
eukprot:s1627_g11.t1